MKNNIERETDWRYTACRAAGLSESSTDCLYKIYVEGYLSFRSANRHKQAKDPSCLRSRFSSNRDKG